MTAADDFSTVAPFEIRQGGQQRVPFVFNSPHSGRYYPARFLSMVRLDGDAIRRSEDCYVDELFSGAVALGAPLMAANFPRSYLDVNREPWELDPRMFMEPVPSFANIRSARVAGGLGTIPKLVGEGLDIYAGRLPLSEALGRIETVYKPYHAALKQLVMRTHMQFGSAVLIDGHSMPASVRIGETGVRPDFIIGDRFGTSASRALTETAISILISMGYTVAHNKPYAGGFITEHYGRPARNLHALQIEINRGLYMNEQTFRKSAGFDALTDDLTCFCAELMASLTPVDDLPLAAE
ncbi:N-formylglutamate amidohydrolase [Pseudaminobacter arsenicus]|uniref:N-formylglutamate amidohydrolase n=1 Tax=Borborobacter arsenicus TaxID=1851146 RepID=A0A432V5P8_9HYPH|nr:N-formylglutamate amidohydrolase [Pseudaminobacter arsenicus]RUM97480.1 N-formylglutamate amidohydrolase [Pseudaminobacter arsenicus]